MSVYTLEGEHCLSCHDPHSAKEKGLLKITVHKPMVDGQCRECHLAPTEPAPFKTTKSGSELCLECHSSMKKELRRNFIHDPTVKGNCLTCHDPHNPLLPHSPTECSACHREIASKKMVSPHVSLTCKRCHDVPEGHLDTPRYVRANKPVSRELCGSCHATNSGSDRSIAKIELDTHNERYNCWDCHYPHFPEAKQ